MRIELTSHCKVMFTEWYKEYEPKSDWKYPAYDYFTNHSIEYQLLVATMFFDGNEMLIGIEPSLGGGQPVFYGKIHYRHKEHYSTIEQDVIEGMEPYYCIDRLEMIHRCINICNEVYNDGFKGDLVKPPVDDNETDLPF